MESKCETVDATYDKTRSVEMRNGRVHQFWKVMVGGVEYEVEFTVSAEAIRALVIGAARNKSKRSDSGVGRAKARRVG